MGEHIVLGLGNNIDYEIVWDSQVFERAVVGYGISDSELRANTVISSSRDLVISILGFLKSGDGGERFVASPQIILDFAELFQNRITLGGTPVRAAIAMRKLGHRSALHLVTMNEHVRRLLPEGISWICSNDKETVFPHLIVQFRKDTCVQAGDINIRAKQSNRIIYVNDDDNLVMKLAPGFASLAADARVFQVSGFNAMQSSELLAERLKQLLGIIHSLPSDALVFYEDACFHNPVLSAQIHTALSDVIDIYSLNEHELQNYLKRPISLLNPVEVYAALKELSRLIPVPVLVVHTQYWALAFGEQAGRYTKALKGGTTMATTRFRFGDDFSPSDYLETEGLPAQTEGAKFAGALNELVGDTICCIPVVQVKEIDVTTIGLGDAFVGGFLPALAEQ